MTETLIDRLAKGLTQARLSLRSVDPQHPAITEAGYALKVVAQWNSLDRPEAQRQSVLNELAAATEACIEVVEVEPLRVALAEYEGARAGRVIQFPQR